MSDALEAIGDAGTAAFVEKLGAFRGALSEQDRQILDAMLVAAAGGTLEDVQGYIFTTSAARQLALAAVVVLGLGAGTLAPMAGGTAQAAPLDQQSLNVSPSGTL